MTKAAATEGSSQIYSILFRAVPKRGRRRGGFGYLTRCARNICARLFDLKFTANNNKNKSFRQRSTLRIRNTHTVNFVWLLKRAAENFCDFRLIICYNLWASSNVDIGIALSLSLVVRLSALLLDFLGPKLVSTDNFNLMPKRFWMLN